MKNLFNKIALGSAALVTSVSSFAAGPDLSSLTTAIDFGTVTTAVLGAGAAIIVVYLAIKGVKIVLSMVKGS